MIVIVDIEWAVNRYFKKSPTQIAAERVDECWNVTEKFCSLIRPQNESFYDWDQVAYNAGDEEDFLSSETAYTVLGDFLEWLKPDDVLLWWHSNNSKAFSEFIDRILKKSLPVKSIFAKPYINRFLWLEDIPSENMYKLAEWKGIDISLYVQHSSLDDVKLMKEFFKIIEIPQKYFFRSLQQLKKSQKEKRREMKKSYQADVEHKIIHKRNCKKVSDITTETRGYDKLDIPYKRKFIPCDCCKKEFEKLAEYKNKKSYAPPNAVYAFRKDSDVYHKKSCHLLAKSKELKFATKFETVEKNGKRPCKICKPTPSDAWDIIKQGHILKESIEKNKSNISQEDFKLIKRQKNAAKERAEKLQQENLSKTEKDDIYTLTQPGYAFFAAKGYSNFHLGHCAKIHNLSEIRGFSSYEEAMAAGFKPCKNCKPSAKHDVVVSIPINNQIRLDETIEDMEKLCEESGCVYYKEDKYFYIETAVGKWRINPMKLPYRVEHINLIKGGVASGFHRQPRMFLSLYDVVEYIKRHDDTLIKQLERNSINI